MCQFFLSFSKHVILAIISSLLRWCIMISSFQVIINALTALSRPVGTSRGSFSWDTEPFLTERWSVKGNTLGFEMWAVEHSLRVTDVLGVFVSSCLMSQGLGFDSWETMVRHSLYFSHREVAVKDQWHFLNEEEEVLGTQRSGAGAVSGRSKGWAVSWSLLFLLLLQGPGWGHRWAEKGRRWRQGRAPGKRVYIFKGKGLLVNEEHRKVIPLRAIIRKNLNGLTPLRMVRVPFGCFLLRVSQDCRTEFLPLSLISVSFLLCDGTQPSLRSGWCSSFFTGEPSSSM